MPFITVARKGLKMKTFTLLGGEGLNMSPGRIFILTILGLHLPVFRCLIDASWKPPNDEPSRKKKTV